MYKDTQLAIGLTHKVDGVAAQRMEVLGGDGQAPALAEKLRAVLKSGRVLFEESKLYNNSAEITVTVLNGAN